LALISDYNGLMVKINEKAQSFVGGKNKNRHANKKKGCSGDDKAIVFGALETCGKVKTKVLPNV